MDDKLGVECGEGGIGTSSHFGGGGGRCPTVASFKKSQGVQAMAFPSNHICQKWGFPNNFLATN